MSKAADELLMSINIAGRRWRVLLADDHKPMLAAVKRLLQVRYNVVGTACDGETLLDLVGKLAADVAVLDIAMPRLNGVEAARRLKEYGTRTKLVFLTAYGTPEFIRSAFDSGVLGYVLKRRLMTDLLPAIEAALRGERFVSSPLIVP